MKTKNKKAKFGFKLCRIVLARLEFRFLLFRSPVPQISDDPSHEVRHDHQVQNPTIQSRANGSLSIAYIIFYRCPAHGTLRQGSESNKETCKNQEKDFDFHVFS
jgi:hypothetical protein